ncbi:3-carboxy-cis,cis-muconate cycloisomerase [Streptomyces sp. 549]|uniref:3-carboxy-cis,cis-muconate cycloisomerase n=1 Tax=Streptomyces sp. 549 TaxID=3049076 RepID=UPI0024C27977|nr:3-carboxy-cis,cis-muconate cycloisomerase [Streptomyces sp. 549]MDK1471895.1 3-carboxy-cis,cis-muconate cycloisomerase [Streptomyces sp. 549]
MTSADTFDCADVGLLSPVRAGSAAEAATGDLAFLQAMLDAEAALTRAQARLGLAPASAATAVTEAADASRYDLRDLAIRARCGGNPVIPLVAALRAAVGPTAAGHVHRGATSQDILDTAVMLVARRTLEIVLTDLDRSAEALAALADAHRDTPVSGRTLTQHAVPTTFGLKAAGWYTLVRDARHRLAAVLDGLPAQLGGAAGTLAAFAEQPGAASALELRTAFAEEVRLAERALPWHTLRTPVADLGGALAFTAGALGKIAADVLVMARTEIGEVQEASCGPSSAMPHKANPVAATLIAAAARQVPSLSAVLFGSLAAEDERPAGAWHAEWQTLREALRLTGGAARCATELAAGLRPDPVRMRANLDRIGQLIVSERVAIALAPYAGQAQARSLVTAAATESARTDASLTDLLRGLPELADVPEDIWRDLGDPAHYLGCAPALVDLALADTRQESP